MKQSENPTWQLCGLLLAFIADNITFSNRDTSGNLTVSVSIFAVLSRINCSIKNQKNESAL